MDDDAWRVRRQATKAKPRAGAATTGTATTTTTRPGHEGDESKAKSSATERLKARIKRSLAALVGDLVPRVRLPQVPRTATNQLKVLGVVLAVVALGQFAVMSSLVESLPSVSWRPKTWRRTPQRPEHTERPQPRWDTKSFSSHDDVDDDDDDNVDNSSSYATENHEPARATPAPTSRSEEAQSRAWRAQQKFFAATTTPLSLALAKLGYQAARAADEPGVAWVVQDATLALACNTPDAKPACAMPADATSAHRVLHPIPASKDVQFERMRQHATSPSRVSATCASAPLKLSSFLPETFVVRRSTSLAFLATTTTRRKSGHKPHRGEDDPLAVVRALEPSPPSPHSNDEANVPPTKPAFPLLVAWTRLSPALKSLQKHKAFPGLVVQRAVANPMLWHGSVFSLQTVVAIVRTHPLVAYAADGVVHRSLEGFHDHAAPDSATAWFARVTTKQAAHPRFSTAPGDAFKCFDDVRGMLLDRFGSSHDIDTFVDRALRPHMRRIAAFVVSALTWRAPLTKNAPTPVAMACLEFMMDESWNVWLVDVSTDCTADHDPGGSGWKAPCKPALREALTTDVVRAADEVRRKPSKEAPPRVGSLDLLVDEAFPGRSGLLGGCTASSGWEAFRARRAASAARVAKLLLSESGLPRSSYVPPVDEQVRAGGGKARVCSKCGYVTVPDASTCDRCGASLDKVDAAVQSRLRTAETERGGGGDASVTRNDAGGGRGDDSTTSTARARLEAILRKYDPARLANVDSLLARYAGDEDRLVGRLETQYEALSRAKVGGGGDDGGGSARARIVALLTKHDPAKLNTVDSLLEKFRGKEAQLLEQLEMRYAVV